MGDYSKISAEGVILPQVLRGYKVLLADDYADSQLLVSRRLKYLGADVDVADDGQEAVDKALLKDYDVILMDIEMPALDGLEAMKLLRTKHYTKPIIALTAHARRDEKDHLLTAGFDDYIAKPFDRQTLISAIQNARHN